MIHPFTISVDESTLADLRSRLAKTRWPDQIANEKWEMGTNEAYLQELCTYWQQQFDWLKQEAYLNTFAHFKTEIDDIGIHFIHQKGKGKTSFPLLLIHGYPDSFFRFHKLIPLLTEADEEGFSFDVVVPSMPGYGFSGIPAEEGMDPKKMADLFARLMVDELGYDEFFAHGGDWGGSITEQLALYHDDHLHAIHLTDLPFHHTLEQPDDASDAEKKFFEKIQKWQRTEGAYSMIQATKPQSLAYSLTDSPAGLAAWLIEKFYAWSDNGGNLENAFTKDELLTNLTIYWVTRTSNSSMRLYYEAIKSIMAATYNPLIKYNPFDKTGKKTAVPAGFTFFPKDISAPPRELVERYFTIERWNEISSGGHFAAMEQPQALADEIRQFFKGIHQSKSE
ncbi:epoxide hydrolase [Spirosoma sp. BT702]|uniref:Epoxide hydrolase n=1 Tax=Spirosoma profusum TaxID=2771354 RepID=A0A926Y3D0_9BACT|nr:epoxide hydrolase family protein [Spirosoma profusum]MBD2701676.1 epoxide hydrolase [Spirosoma profusum]